MKNILSIIVVLIVGGCGMMGHSSSGGSSQIADRGSDNNGTFDINSSRGSSLQIAYGGELLPKSISMDFPTILKKGGQDDAGVGYSQLKDYVSQIDDVVDMAQINLIILKRAMPEVLERCEGMSSCTFKAREISVELSSSDIDEINSIIEDTISIDSKLYLGELSFKRDYTHGGGRFNYELKLDLVSSDRVVKLYKGGYGDEVEEYQIFRWSDYSRDVATIYLYEDINHSVDVKIYYSSDESGQESMHVLKSTNGYNLKNSMNLTLSDKDDVAFKLTANSIEEELLEDNSSLVNSFSSNGEIADDSSKIIFSRNVADENSSMEERVISEVVCSGDECVESNLSSISDISNESNLVDNLEFYQLKIGDSNLSDGSYLILPPDMDIENLSAVDIFKLAIGTFTILDGKAQGEIHSSLYNTLLDELTILKLEEGETILFKSIIDRPNIELENPLEALGTNSRHFYLQPQYLEYMEGGL
ncbi:MAG: hypothetical protein GXO06_04695 [Epsilonproteobacteria bacterium]|nr:hypothetical protein [Campylobacterota bacterium]